MAHVQVRTDTGKTVWQAASQKRCETRSMKAIIHGVARTREEPLPKWIALFSMRDGKAVFAGHARVNEF